MSRRLLSRNICDILARLDIRNHNDPALHTFLKEAKFDFHMLHSFMREIISCSDCNCGCVFNPNTLAVNMRFLLLSALPSYA
jgi:hypothetical protein